MASFMTADDLIASVKRRISLPINQITFTNEDLLAFADEETAMGLVPSIQRMREDYLLITVEVPLVQGAPQRYRIPYRATGNKLREIAYRDNNGNIYEMTRIYKEDLPYYNGPVTPTLVYNYYIENDEFVLVPGNLTPPQGFMDVSFYMRPNSLVLSEDIGIITNIDLNTGVIALDKIPSDFSVTKLFDMVQQRSPHKTYDFDLNVLAIDTIAKTVTFDVSDIPSTLAVGDRICLAEQTDIPQIPSDLHVVLAHRVATRCLEAMGDLENLQAANQKLGELENNLQQVLDDRVEGSPKIIVNRKSILRSGLAGRRYRRGW